MLLLKINIYKHLGHLIRTENIGGLTGSQIEEGEPRILPNGLHSYLQFQLKKGRIGNNLDV
jgi:hypothetical protein